MPTRTSHWVPMGTGAAAGPHARGRVLGECALSGSSSLTPEPADATSTTPEMAGGSPHRPRPQYLATFGVLATLSSFVLGAVQGFTQGVVALVGALLLAGAAWRVQLHWWRTGTRSVPHRDSLFWIASVASVVPALLLAAWNGVLPNGVGPGPKVEVLPTSATTSPSGDVWSYYNKASGGGEDTHQRLVSGEYLDQTFVAEHNSIRSIAVIAARENHPDEQPFEFPDGTVGALRLQLFEASSAGEVTREVAIQLESAVAGPALGGVVQSVPLEANNADAVFRLQPVRIMVGEQYIVRVRNAHDDTPISVAVRPFPDPQNPTYISSSEQPVRHLHGYALSGYVCVQRDDC